LGTEVKFFFHGYQFSLAFGEKKSILRNKKDPPNTLMTGLDKTGNGREENNAREILLILTKSAIFDK
jgi:hypothetical protein